MNCTPPAMDDFPHDLFTETQRQNGALVFHITTSLYLFLALALVCDKYFVPAVERICKGGFYCIALTTVKHIKSNCSSKTIQLYEYRTFFLVCLVRHQRYYFFIIKCIATH